MATAPDRIAPDRTAAHGDTALPPAARPAGAQRMLHPWQPLGRRTREDTLSIERADGAYVVDAAGRRYLDAVGGLWCNSVGFGREDVAAAIGEQARRLAYASCFVDMGHTGATALAEALCARAPRGIEHAMFSTGGSTAIDTAIRLAHFFHACAGRPQRRHVLVHRHAYHGSTYLAASLTGEEDRAPGFAFETGWIHAVACPDPDAAPPGVSPLAHRDALLAAIERRIAAIGAERIAAFVTEPVLGAGGVIVPPPGYHRALRDLCRRHGILYVADEVVTAMGRVGHWFASEDAFDATPDIVTTAKCLTSGYVPLGATLYSREIHEVIRAGDERRVFAHGFTNSGHPLACAAALRVIEIVEREGILANVTRVGAHLHARLAALRSLPIVGAVRGLGLMAGIEYYADRARREHFPEALDVARRVSQRCEAHGVLVRSRGHVNILSPCLALDVAQADRIADVLTLSIQEVAAQL